MSFSTITMKATAETFTPSPSPPTMLKDISSSSYKEALQRAFTTGHYIKFGTSPPPPCPYCLFLSPGKEVIKPYEQAVALGTVAWLPRKNTLPHWSVAHFQNELNDGAFGHPGVPFERSPCGHLYRVAPVTSFSKHGSIGDIQAKYPNPNQHVLDNQFWEYLAIDNARPSNTLGSLEVDKPLEKTSYVHCDGMYWIEARNLGNMQGKASTLTPAALSLVQLTCATLEQHREDNNIEPLHTRMSSSSPPLRSSPSPVESLLSSPPLPLPQIFPSSPAQQGFSLQTGSSSLLPPQQSLLYYGMPSPQAQPEFMLSSGAAGYFDPAATHMAGYLFDGAYMPMLTDANSGGLCGWQWDLSYHSLV